MIPFPCWLVEDKQHKGVGAPGGGRGWSVSDTLSLEPVMEGGSTVKESDIRLLMEISPDNNLQPGWQRGVERQRAKTTRAGDLLYVKSYPIWDTSHRKDAAAKLQQARERKGTTDAQRRLNARKAEEKLVQLINANFASGDMLPTLTYAPRLRPQSLKDAQKDVRNFLSRLKRICRKRGLPDPAYVYVTETLQKRRGLDYHHHMVLRCGLDRDEVEALWRQKHGHGNIRTAWNAEEGLTGYAKYIAKQVCSQATESIRDLEGSKTHRWCASKGLTIPVETTADKKISRRRVEAMAREISKDRETAMLHLAACYPGYKVLELDVRTSDWVSGAYVAAVLVKEDHHVKEFPHQSRRGRAGRAYAP